jgi:hypothetical protein
MSEYGGLGNWTPFCAFREADSQSVELRFSTESSKLNRGDGVIGVLPPWGRRGQRRPVSREETSWRRMLFVLHPTTSSAKFGEILGTCAQHERCHHSRLSASMYLCSLFSTSVFNPDNSVGASLSSSARWNDAKA